MTARVSIAVAQAVIGVLLVGLIWLGLPARWWPVDVLGTALGIAALVAAAIAALGQRTSFSVRVVYTVLWAELVLGALAVSLLLASMSQLAGSYGPVGDGGALLMGTIIALILPYLIGLPALQLRLLKAYAER
jgi:hypothetical protein